MKYILSFLFAGVCLFAFAQPPVNYTSSGLLSQLKKLDVLGTVLYIAAHPDDENTRLLAYLANEKQYRTGYLSLTRGDGGQNLIGDEQGVELGLIRTQELLAARRIDGAEQFFTRAYDFGYSKSSEETFRIWGHDKILSDVVWVIRKFRPDVIIARFPEDKRAGHGHHAASGILAREAFEAAGDPHRFPEQLKQGVTVWKPRRLLWNTFSFGRINTQSEDQFKVEVGQYNPLLGEGYGEIAAHSRSQHKSQGFGVAAQRGSSFEYFVTVKGEPPVNDLMDGVDISWNRAFPDKNEAAKIQRQLGSLLASFSCLHPEKSAPQLVRLYRAVKNCKDAYWKTQKLKEIRQLVEACSGLFMEATVSNPYAVRGENMTVTLTANNRTGVSTGDLRVDIDGITQELGALRKNINTSRTVTIPVRENEKLTQPYWLEYPMEKGNFTVPNQQLIGKAENDPVSVTFKLTVEGEPFQWTKPIRYKYTDPVKGEVYEPLVIMPADLPKEKELNVNVRLKLLNETARIGGQAAAGSSIPAPRRVLRVISHDHIPDISYFRTDSAKEVALDLKITGKKIGYIEGAGDKVTTALTAMGYEVTVLSDKDLATGDLSGYQAIITGVRAYNVRESLNTYYERLMKYIEQGGNLIVQYNTSSQIGPVKARIGPYPFSISRTRVTDENAAVTMLNPQLPVLNFPNKITAKDFEGWIQERSIYHAAGWDDHYQPVFSMHDPGEEEDAGSLITAKYGKGNFVYTGLVFFRELPVGIPGAYRLLANIIALQ